MALLATPGWRPDNFGVVKVKPTAQREECGILVRGLATHIAAVVKVTETRLGDIEGKPAIKWLHRGRREATMSRINWCLLTGILFISACAGIPPPPQQPGSAALQLEPLQLGPPPDGVEEVIPPAPSANDFWIKGYWHWGNNGERVWVSGHWEAKRPGWHWVPAHWDMPGEQWEFVAGHWEPN
jgi:hypothetical protein